MKLYPDSKVYIFCPGNLLTGGPESLHQLASQLITFGVETYMVYSDPENNSFNPEDPVHDAYKKYHVPYTKRLEDSAKNVVIIAETITPELYGGKKLRRVLWWMSVNNYLLNVIDIVQNSLNVPLDRPMKKFFTFYDADKNIEHWGQSEYVRQFLRLNGVMKINSVETPMSQIFLRRAAQIDLNVKKNFVAYNPKKGLEITQQLINFAPDIDFRPIENMTPDQVQELLAQAKIYIDFGEFPGRERLPREATISKCVVITGKRGAAGNDVDYNIPDEFKFGSEEAELYAVIEKIREVFENFSGAYAAQKAFREKELNAKKNFTAQVAEVFGIKKLPPQSVALVQGVSEKSYQIAQALLTSKDFTTKFIIDDDVPAEKFIWREHNQNFLRLDKDPIEIISRADAKFLYLEGRIKKFALFEPTDAELDEFKTFYKPNESDVLIFKR